MNALTRTSLLASTSRRTVAAGAVSLQARAKHSLPDLPYAYDALEPSISKEIMTLHHTKHHQTYVNGLNAAEEAYGKALAASDPLTLIKLQSALKFNGGGHINHDTFWKNLAPYGSSATKLRDGPLKTAIDEAFGSLDGLKTKFNADTAAVQGSGWGWLGYNTFTKKLEVTTTANQDPLVTHIPIIGVDIWEHAFYLQYKNVKPDYLKAVWDVINFDEAEARFAKAVKA